MKQAITHEKKNVFVPRLVQTSLCSLILMSAFGPVASAATEVKANITKITNQGNAAYLEFSVPMVGQDILTSTGFESGEETPNFNWRGAGNQSVVTNPSGSGRVVSLQDTITNRKGNLYDFPETSAISSRFAMQGRSVPNDALISIQFDALSTKGTNSMQFNASTGWFDRGFDMMDDAGQYVLYVDPINWRSAPASFRVKTASGIAHIADGQVRTVVSSRAQDYTYGLLQYQWSQANQTFTRIPGAIQPWSTVWPNGQTITPKLESFAAGERVLTHNQTGFMFPERSIPSDLTWRTYSMNTQVSQLSYYDLMKYGIFPTMGWQTDGSLYIDNLKFGYAERANIYRDGQQVYSGFESSFTDHDATDKAKPNPVANLNYSISKSNKQITANWTAAADTGTNYTYKIQGQLRDGTLGSIQDPNTISVTSGVKGYIVISDASPNTQITSGAITTSETSITVTPKEGDRYVHVASVDHAGNISATQTIQLTDQDRPELILTQVNTNPTQEGTVISMSASDQTSWVQSITLPDESVVKPGVTSYPVNNNGNYSFKATDFFGNSTEQTITVSNIDRLAPIIQLAPESMDILASNPDPFSVSFHVTDDMPGQPQVEYYMSTHSDIPASNSTVWKTVEPDFKVTVDQVGSWWIFVKATDAAGNEVIKPFFTFTYRPLPAPVRAEDITITSPASDSLTIQLANPLHDVAYRVYINGQTDRRKIFRDESGILTVTGLTPGTTYNVAVETYNLSGKGGWTERSSFTRPDAAIISEISPVEGTEDTVIASVYGITGADHYVWELYDSLGIPVVTSESNEKVQMFKVTPNAQYSLRVYATNASGAGLASIRNFQALPTLTGLHIMNVQANAVNLGWQSVTGDVYYDLYRHDRKDGVRIGAEGTVIGDTYTSVTRATYTPDMIAYYDTNLQSGTEYNYRIAAANGAGYSLWRNTSVWTLPDAPSLHVSDMTSESLTYQWSQVRGATAYDVYMNGEYIGRQRENKFSLSGLDADTEYRLDVLAINASGTGAVASLTELTLPAQPQWIALLPQENEVMIRIQDHSADRYEFVANGVTYHSVGASPSIQVTGLPAGDTISGTLIAYNASGASKPFHMTLHTLPGEVTKLEAVPSESQTLLTWNTVPGALRYWIETKQGLKAVEGNHFSAEAIAPNTFQTYRVWAEGMAGKGTTAAEVRSLGIPVPINSNPIQIQNVTHDQATLTFAPFIGAVSYNIYLQDKLIAETTDTGYRLESLQSATSYTDYSVRAVNAMSMLSKPYSLSFTTLPADEFTFNVTNRTIHSIDLDIGNVEPDALVVVRLQQSTGEMREVYRGQAGQVKIEDLATDTSYKVWVHTVSPGGHSQPKFLIVRTDAKRVDQLSSLMQTMPIHTEVVQNPLSVTEFHPILKAKPTTFSDIEGRYSQQAISLLAEKSILNGYMDGTFRPKAAVTRAEFVTMLDKAGFIPSEQVNHQDKNSFKDIVAGDWYADTITRAANAGIIHGYPNQLFKPDQTLNRAEAAQIISKVQSVAYSRNSFTDEKSLPVWAQDAIHSTPYFIGYDTGKFEPKKKISREEVAMILFRMFDN